MKKQLLFFLSIIIFLASCKKEVDYAPGGGGGGGGTTNQKLVRIGTRSGADTTTTDYNYNTAGKLIRQYTGGNVQGTAYFFETKLNRNGSGIITSVVLKSDQFAALGVDSIVTVVKYNTGTSKYTGTITALTIFGFALKDSAVFTYDGSGKITQQESFSADPITGIYQKASKDVYTYLASGNVGNEKYYQWNDITLSYDLSEEYTEEYDTKVSPLQMGIEAIFLGDLVLAATNNLTKSIYVDATDPSNNETTSLTYTYNTSNKPANAVSTVTPGGAVTIVTYTYQ
ncbi:MAG: hypothetical protein E6H07_19905 [Bacteroidetes bacterium]|nr:MAG: hypothetical protein E6H07_19905 [Bacteroidota bacterium]